MIQLENVSKEFKSKKGVIRAVSDVSLHVKKGEIHGVIGYSGAGKSTLIRCVNLLEAPTAGKVRLNDREFTELSKSELLEERKNIGMIFQGFNLLRTATVEENISIPLKLIGVEAAEIPKRVEKYLEIVGLTEKKNAYPAQLSGGQKQRVAIARALAQEPDVLLSDEATSALDPETTESILDLLLKINAEFGITILLITHEMHVIQKICDHVYVMDGGEIVEDGPVIDLFSKPQHKTTRSFLNTISQRKLSKEFVANLKKSGSVLRLTFRGEATGDPVLAAMAKEFDVKPNILTANIMELKNGVIGNLDVHIAGAKEEVGRSLEFLKSKGVVIEEWDDQYGKI
ncbi:ATP-binding cassette domain-containing protein [Planococcus shenhongbingii]|uniref:methionine ABC transporter ATP-binding protein n=1 Tax=Planococcus shenhongbingii TaxID=3058398 RepID=UPI002615DD68|nr:ATP-binding cassette domain-containing protein [Planococcus sp. N016]WKA59337.1 ATP-binding cassette domain-containing protein [Planococcus sp. N016]